MSVLAAALTPLGWLLRGKRPDERLSIRHAPQLAAPRTIDLRSDAFRDGATIPDRHCTMDLGPNISPELHWSGGPGSTAQLLLIIEDLDAPAARPSLHTIALLPPGPGRPGERAGGNLDEGALTTGNPGIRFVPAHRGRLGYAGPRPLPGHGVHRYGFHLYALTRPVSADRALTGIADVLAAVDGHVAAAGLLEGRRRG